MSAPGRPTGRGGAAAHRIHALAGAIDTFGLVRRAIALLVLLSTLGTASMACAAEEFLDADAAFRVSASAQDDRQLTLRFDVAPGYHLYRDRIGITASGSGVALQAPQLPPGTREVDEALGREVEVLRGQVTVAVPLTAAAIGDFELRVAHQGCADRGLCYPPAETTFIVRPATPPARGLHVQLRPEPVAPATAAPPAVDRSAATNEGADGDTGRFEQVLQSRRLWAVAGVFMLAGVLLSLTPCVLPMLPILSAIIVGQGGTVSRGRGLALALSYALGMALVYTGLGVAAGLAGEGLAAQLQNPWALGAFAVLLVALSLSMFGAYELQLPAAMQGRLTRWSNGLRGGRMAGVFAMGGLSALIVGPCVAAPLAGALLYIGRTHDVVLGAVALFSMAAGLSVPLLLMGASAGALLPRAGRWMEGVKHAFGLMLLLVALWMVSPLLPEPVLMGVVALLLLGVAAYVGAFERLELSSPRHALRKAAGLMLGSLALLQLVGAASGGSDLLHPLKHLAPLAALAPPTAGSREAALPFVEVGSLPALQAAVAGADRPVMVDLRADWCSSCKEFESLTLADAEVRARMAGYALLRVDVTANNDAQRALMRHFGLYGPPAVLFFEPGGAERRAARVVGYLDAHDFREHLKKLVFAGPAGPRDGSPG